MSGVRILIIPECSCARLLHVPSSQTYIAQLVIGEFAKSSDLLSLFQPEIDSDGEASDECNNPWASTGAHGWVFRSGSARFWLPPFIEVGDGRGASILENACCAHWTVPTKVAIRRI